MRIFFNRKGQLNIEGAKIMYGKFRNFAGRPTEFDRNGGKRYFSVLIEDQEVAEQMIEDGWRVKTYIPKGEGAEPVSHIKVNVSYHDDPNLRTMDPEVNLWIGKVRDRLDIDTISRLDKLEIMDADIRINHSRRDDEGKMSAYLDRLDVVIDEDWMDKKYADSENPEEEPW